MAQLFVIRHAEKALNVTQSAEESLHAKLTKKGKNDAFSFGKSMKYILDNERITLIPNKLERCHETALSFKRGYGPRARVVDSGRFGGWISYTPREMVRMAGYGGSHNSIISRFLVKGPLATFCTELFSRFERDYPKELARWLAGDFSRNLVSPNSMADAVEKIAGIAGSNIMMMFVSDVHISAISAVYGIRQFVEKQPDYLTGLWNHDFPGSEWSPFVLAEQVK